MKVTVLGAVLMMVGLGAQAMPQALIASCVENGSDICALAKQTEQHLKDRLPIKLNALITLERLVAQQNTLIGTIRLDEMMGNEFRMALNENPKEGNAVKEMLFERATKDACHDKETASFLDAGGIVRYNFVYADNDLLSTFDVSQCD